MSEVRSSLSTSARLESIAYPWIWKLISLCLSTIDGVNAPLNFAVAILVQNWLQRQIYSYYGMCWIAILGLVLHNGQVVRLQSSNLSH